MVEAHIRIEADREGGEQAILGEETVSEGEQRVDRIGGRTAVAAMEVEAEVGGLPGRDFKAGQLVIQLVRRLDHAIELLEISRRRAAFQDRKSTRLNSSHL